MVEQDIAKATNSIERLKEPDYGPQRQEETHGQSG